MPTVPTVFPPFYRGHPSRDQSPPPFEAASISFTTAHRTAWESFGQASMIAARSGSSGSASVALPVSASGSALSSRLNRCRLVLARQGGWVLLT